LSVSKTLVVDDSQPVEFSTRYIGVLSISETLVFEMKLEIDREMTSE